MPDHSENIQILAVDDQELNLLLVKAAFENCVPAAIVLTANNGQEALELLRANTTVDIVFLDLDMPIMGGLDTLSAIRADSTIAHIPVIVVTASREEKKRALALGASDFTSKPFDPEELRLRARNHIRVKAHHDLLTDVNIVLEKEVWQKIAELQTALQNALDAEYEIALRLGRACEYRDNETGLHAVRLSHMSEKLGILAGLSEEDCRLLRYSAPLHDVGKIGITDAVLQKPGKLTDDEFELMKTHAAIGAEMLRGADRFPVLKAAEIIAAQHHERWNGTGYPNKLSGNDIHIYARIVAIVDVFDALSSERCYKPAFSFEKSLQILVEGRGVHFDPTLLDVFIKHYDTFVQIKKSMPDTHDAGSPSPVLPR